MSWYRRPRVLPQLQLNLERPAQRRGHLMAARSYARLILSLKRDLT